MFSGRSPPLPSELFLRVASAMSVEVVLVVAQPDLHSRCQRCTQLCVGAWLTGLRWRCKLHCNLLSIHIDWILRFIQFDLINFRDGHAQYSLGTTSPHQKHSHIHSILHLVSHARWLRDLSDFFWHTIMWQIGRLRQHTLPVFFWPPAFPNTHIWLHRLVRNISSVCKLSPVLLAMGRCTSCAWSVSNGEWTRRGTLAGWLWSKASTVSSDEIPFCRAPDCNISSCKFVVIDQFLMKSIHNDFVFSGATPPKVMKSTFHTLILPDWRCCGQSPRHPASFQTANTCVHQATWCRARRHVLNFVPRG